jgi:hypothetical protein
VDDRRRSQILGEDGKTLDARAQNAYFSTTYNAIELQLDKETLRRAGWRDGMPLSLQVMTAKDGEKDAVDQVVARTDTSASPESMMGQVFRWEGKTVYYIVTDRFQNGDRRNDSGIDPADPERFHGGDWQGVIDKMDYLKDLGVDCIWLSCPYENDRAFFGKDGFHGYWPHDLYKTEPSFGSMEKLRELVDKAHDKGMKVMLDVVVNHTGYNHPFVNDPKYRDWFHREGDIKGVTQWHMEHAALAGLPDLAHENPEVAKYLIDNHKWWLEQTGVDAFRMDAIRHVPEDFLRDFDREMHKTREDYYSVGESRCPSLRSPGYTRATSSKICSQIIPPLPAKALSR